MYKLIACTSHNFRRADLAQHHQDLNDIVNQIMKKEGPLPVSTFRQPHLNQEYSDLQQFNQKVPIRFVFAKLISFTCIIIIKMQKQ